MTSGRTGGRPCVLRLWLSLLLSSGAVHSPPAAAQVPAPAEFTALPLPVGSGARALGQGGAFTAIADDATAAVWNPAGLVQLERPELSLVATHLATTARFTKATRAEVSGGGTRFDFGSDEDVQRSDLNFLSATYPLAVWGRNLVVSLNYHQRYDFHQELAFATSSMAEDPGGLGSSTLTQDLDFRAAGGIGALSPAVGVEVSPRLSFGVAIHFLRNEFLGGDGYRQDLQVTAEQVSQFLFLPSPSTFRQRFSRHTVSDFAGTNATLGALWRVWQGGARRLTLAAVVETPFTADVDRGVRSQWTDGVQDGVPIADSVVEGEEHLAIDFPWSVTIGAALRLSDRTTVALDVAWSEWSDWVQEDRDTGRRTRPIGGAAARSEIDDLFAGRLGVEHVVPVAAGKLPLRAGLFYEPRPGIGNEQSIYGVSAGAGFTAPRFSLDAAYQYRTGDDLQGGNISTTLQGTSFEVEEHLFIASLIWYL